MDEFAKRVGGRSDTCEIRFRQRDFIGSSITGCQRVSPTGRLAAKCAEGASPVSAPSPRACGGAGYVGESYPALRCFISRRKLYQQVFRCQEANFGELLKWNIAILGICDNSMSRSIDAVDFGTDRDSHFEKQIRWRWRESRSGFEVRGQSRKRIGDMEFDTAVRKNG